MMWQEWDKLEKKEEELHVPTTNCMHVVILLRALFSTRTGKVLQGPFDFLSCFLAF